ncbi:MAG: AAA family ATPase [Deltaproteobacteria bacterium]|nr:AAA family ATPase [Deltaproteobacteria bacterium]
MAQYDINLREYWRIIKKRKLTIIFTAIILGVFSTIFTVLRAPTPLYTSSCSIKFEKQTSIEGVFQRAFSWSGGGELDTLISVLKSYSVMKQVAEKLGKIPKYSGQEGSLLQSNVVTTVQNLESKVKVSRENFTNIINIETTDPDPAFAQLLANTIALTYRGIHFEEQNKRKIAAASYISKQLNEVRRKLRESEDKFNRFTRENRLVSFDLQSENLLLRSNEIKDEIRKLKEANVNLNALFAKLRQFIKNPSGFGNDFYSTYANQQYQDANTSLLELLLKRDSLLEDFTTKHPYVIEISRKIIETARKMEVFLQLQINGLNTREADLKKDLTMVDKKTNELMEKKLEYNRLTREVDSYNEMVVLLERKNQEALIRKADKPEEVTVVRPAFLPTSPVNPPKTATTGAMGVVIGLILGMVLAFIAETFDTSIGAIEDVEETLGTQVLGVIPHEDIKDIQESLERAGEKVRSSSPFSGKVHLAAHFARQSMLAESFRSLRTNIQFHDLDKKVKTIAVTSGSPQEGKTTVAINLAITMAQAGTKTLLVGSDLRKPMVAQAFGVETSPGLTDILLGNYSWRDAIKTITDIIIGKMEMDDVMITPGLDNLYIITSGTIPPNSAELIDSQRLVDFIKEVKEEYDIIIFDAPPVLSTADATILGTKVDAVLLVYRVGSISRGLLKRTTLQLSRVKSNLMGVVLNGMKPEVSPDFQDFKYYRYYSSYGEEGKVKKEKRKRAKRDKRGVGPLKILIILIALALIAVGLLWQAGILPIDKYLFKNKEPSSKPSQSIKPPVLPAGSGKTAQVLQEQISAIGSGPSQAPIQDEENPLSEERSLQPIDESFLPNGSGDSFPSTEKEVAENNLRTSRGTEDREKSSQESLLSRHSKLSVNVAAANLRSRATTESSILYKLKRGREVALVKEKGEWYIVKFKDGRASWGHQSLFLRNGNTSESAPFSQTNEKAEGKAVLNVDIGIVREKPSFKSRKKYLLKKGCIVMVHEANGDWFLVELEDGSLGWAHKTLFSKKTLPSET